MTHLYEYQGKALLRQYDLGVPDGKVAYTSQEAAAVARELGGSVVIKAQTWSTNRASEGGIRFAHDPDQAQAVTTQILGRKIGGVPVTQVLVETKLSIQQEFFVSFGVDDTTRAPFLLFSRHGGRGIENRRANVHRRPIRISQGLRAYQVRDFLRQAGIEGRLLIRLGQALEQLWRVCRHFEARSLEVNPLALAEDDRLYALDCRITIDDYAIFRHPELGIEVARELSRPPTRLDRIAYNVEADDYRGTFYFFEMETDPAGGPRIGFHGGGGGGSMLAMDTLLKEGFQLANFSDLSGNPPASKIYRAARLILSQPNLAGYFHAGSGVASQELTQTAQALVKAFCEAPLTVPAVIRLGGNAELEAIQLLEAGTRDLSVPVVAFGRDTTLATCARRLGELIDDQRQFEHTPDISWPAFSISPDDYVFSTLTGQIAVDHTACTNCQSKACLAACPPEILVRNGRGIVLAISPQEAQRGGCVECAACQVACHLDGQRGLHIGWPIAELELS
jgi:succinyl-CoA synthetase beta subunit